MSRPIGACRLVTLAHSLNSGSQDLAPNSMMSFLRRSRTCVTPTSRSSKALARASTASAWSPRASRRPCRGTSALVFPVGSFNSRHQVALSLPSVVGRQGAVETFLPDMSDDETRALGRSAETLGGAVRKYLHKS